MILTETKNWKVEQGITGNYLMIYDYRETGECCIISHHARTRTIECNDDLSELPKSLKEIVWKWCEDKAQELLAENKVMIDKGAKGA